MGASPNAVYMAGIRTKKLLPYMCSSPCVEIRLMAILELFRPLVCGYPVSSLAEVMLYTCLAQSRDTVMIDSIHRILLGIYLTGRISLVSK